MNEYTNFHIYNNSWFSECSVARVVFNTCPTRLLMSGLKSKVPIIFFKKRNLVFELKISENIFECAFKSVKRLLGRRFASFIRLNVVYCHVWVRNENEQMCEIRSVACFFERLNAIERKPPPAIRAPERVGTEKIYFITPPKSCAASFVVQQ